MRLPDAVNALIGGTAQLSFVCDRGEQSPSGVFSGVGGGRDQFRHIFNAKTILVADESVDPDHQRRSHVT